MMTTMSERDEALWVHVPRAVHEGGREARARSKSGGDNEESRRPSPRPAPKRPRRTGEAREGKGAGAGVLPRRPKANAHLLLPLSLFDLGVGRARLTLRRCVWRQAGVGRGGEKRMREN